MAPNQGADLDDDLEIDVDAVSLPDQDTPAASPPVPGGPVPAGASASGQESQPKADPTVDPDYIDYSDDEVEPIAKDEGLGPAQAPVQASAPESRADATQPFEDADEGDAEPLGDLDYGKRGHESDPPVLVRYDNEELPLFPTKHYSGPCVLPDHAARGASLDRLFEVVRRALGTRIQHDEDLGLHMADMRATIYEDSNDASKIHFHELLDAFDLLVKQDGIQELRPLRISLTKKARFSTRANEWLEAACDGKGFSELSFASEEAHEPDEGQLPYEDQTHTGEDQAPYEPGEVPDTSEYVDQDLGEWYEDADDDAHVSDDSHDAQERELAGDVASAPADGASADVMDVEPPSSTGPASPSIGAVHGTDVGSTAASTETIQAGPGVHHATPPASEWELTYDDADEELQDDGLLSAPSGPDQAPPPAPVSMTTDVDAPSPAADAAQDGAKQAASSRAAPLSDLTRLKTDFPGPKHGVPGFDYSTVDPADIIDWSDDELLVESDHGQAAAVAAAPSARAAENGPAARTVAGATAGRSSAVPSTQQATKAAVSSTIGATGATKNTRAWIATTPTPTANVTTAATRPSTPAPSADAERKRKLAEVDMTMDMATGATDAAVPQPKKIRV